MTNPWRDWADMYGAGQQLVRNRLMMPYDLAQAAANAAIAMAEAEAAPRRLADTEALRQLELGGARYAAETRPSPQELARARQLEMQQRELELERLQREPAVEAENRLQKARELFARLTSSSPTETMRTRTYGAARALSGIDEETYQSVMRSMRPSNEAAMADSLAAMGNLLPQPAGVAVSAMAPALAQQVLSDPRAYDALPVEVDLSLRRSTVSPEYDAARTELARARAAAALAQADVNRQRAEYIPEMMQATIDFLKVRTTEVPERLQLEIDRLAQNAKQHMDTLAYNLQRLGLERRIYDLDVDRLQLDRERLAIDKDQHRRALAVGAYNAAQSAVARYNSIIAEMSATGYAEGNEDLIGLARSWRNNSALTDLQFRIIPTLEQIIGISPVRQNGQPLPPGRQGGVTVAPGGVPPAPVLPSNIRPRQPSQPQTQEPAPLNVRAMTTEQLLAGLKRGLAPTQPRRPTTQRGPTQAAPAAAKTKRTGKSVREMSNEELLQALANAAKRTSAGGR